MENKIQDKTDAIIKIVLELEVINTMNVKKKLQIIKLLENISPSHNSSSKKDCFNERCYDYSEIYGCQLKNVAKKCDKVKRSPS